MLNLKNTLDGYLKNVEVIGNTIQDTNNLANIRSVGDKVEGQELYNISIQVDNGNGVSEVVEILSPVQLEKVGSVVDKLICKDGVWGVEKNIKKVQFKATSCDLTSYSNGLVRMPIPEDIKVGSKVSLCEGFLEIGDATKWQQKEYVNTYSNGVISNRFIDVVIDKSIYNTNEMATRYVDGKMYYYQTTQPQFIPLPHDQQVKLRTFAGQTNVSFLTEIAGQIKAQVPKSLGATVNTHTEQIKDLHNSLDRVKKLEETTVSTIETVKSFTTVNETNNGYFEDVKLEGKTLVNLAQSNNLYYQRGINNVGVGLDLTSTIKAGLDNRPNRCVYKISVKPNTPYTFITCGNTIYNNYSIVQTSNNIVVSPVANWQEFSLFTPSPTVDTIYVHLKVDANNSDFTSIDQLKNHLIILEGDYTNNPPEFFEGLMSVGQDVEEVSVESVNENLWSNGRITMGIDNVTPENANAYVYLKRGDYFLSCRYTNDSDSSTGFRFSVKRNGYAGEIVSELKNINSAFTINDDGLYYIAIGRTSAYNGKITIGDICLTLSSNSIQHIPHQSNKKPLLYYNPTTETWEKPILREYDTIEKHSDGKYYYHKRSKEVVLNGSESWVNHNSANPGFLRFYVYTSDILVKGDGVADRFPWQSAVTLNTATRELIGSHIDSQNLYVNILADKLSTQDLPGFKAWLQANPTTVVYKLAQEEVYECTNIDLMTYSGETNYIINSGAISPKSVIKVHNNISNVVKILQEKVSLLENTFIAGLKSVLSGDMYSLATILYPEDFEQHDNTEQDIMVIPE